MNMQESVHKAREVIRREHQAIATENSVQKTFTAEAQRSQAATKIMQPGIDTDGHG